MLCVYNFVIVQTKRVVTFISIYYLHGMVIKTNKTGKEEMKPLLVYDYNIQI